jgi:hypothetical protein
MLPSMEYCKTVPSVEMPKPGPLTNTRLPALKASLLLATTVPAPLLTADAWQAFRLAPRSVSANDLDLPKRLSRW